ncbi:hypothetical protein [Effusibacillus lacus]|uniref:hypothetical protein n=1 Tax=Effusibacillus lacus TaxID=1348429 RepID=UPI0010E86643|nr:hypothetical protein [Effusibacillus lacus]TCS72014.1 hypothetical protein EDD64_1237 [Effusibacillus lacus]
MKSNQSSRILLFGLLTMAMAVLPACGNSTKETSTQGAKQQAAKSNAYQPVTI